MYEFCWAISWFMERCLLKEGGLAAAAWEARHAAAPSGELMTDTERLRSEDHQHSPSDSLWLRGFTPEIWDEAPFWMEDANINTQHIFCAEWDTSERDRDRDTVFKAAIMYKYCKILKYE